MTLSDGISPSPKREAGVDSVPLNPPLATGAVPQLCAVEWGRMHLKSIDIASQTSTVRLCDLLLGENNFMKIFIR